MPASSMSIRFSFDRAKRNARIEGGGPTPKPIPNTQTGSLTDYEHGTNDARSGFSLSGDAASMYDNARGGNDALIGSKGGTFYNVPLW